MIALPNAQMAPHQRQRQVGKLLIEAAERLEKFHDALESLVDWQNGCPLPSYEHGWNRAMDDAYALLGRPERERQE